MDRGKQSLETITLLFAYKVRGLEFKVFHSLLFSSVSGLGCFMLDLSPVAQRVFHILLFAYNVLGFVS